MSMSQQEYPHPEEIFPSIEGRPTTATATPEEMEDIRKAEAEGIAARYNPDAIKPMTIEERSRLIQYQHKKLSRDRVLIAWLTFGLLITWAAVTLYFFTHLNLIVK